MLKRNRGRTVKGINRALILGLISILMVPLLTVTGVQPPAPVFAEDDGCYDEENDVFLCSAIVLAYTEDPFRDGQTLVSGTNSRGNIFNYTNQVIQSDDNFSYESGAESLLVDPCTPGTGIVRYAAGGVGRFTRVGTVTISGSPPVEMGEACSNDGARYVDAEVIVEFDEPVDSITELSPIEVALYEGSDSSGTLIDSDNNLLVRLEEGTTNGSTTKRLEKDGESLSPGTYTVCATYSGNTLCDQVELGVDDITVLSRITIDGDTGEIDVDNSDVIENPVESDGASQTECSGFSVLGWILCPITTGLLRFIENIFNGVILTHLEVDPLNDAADEDSAERAVFDIWNSFRIIANALFVIVFLVAIFGQGLAGFQVFSAYDFRRILPRLVLGAIGIQLSWFFVGFMVDVFNVIGAGTRGLILAPVDGLQSFDFDFGAVADIVTAATAGVAVWAARFTLSINGILLLLPSLLLPIALALLTALVVILFRKMLIFVLIVVSPIAFVLGILPNTQVFFKQWWEFFWKALFMYPLIIAFIAAGELTAKVLVAGDESSGVNQILGIFALFAPYFLIGTTFRLAGAGLAAAAGGLQNMGNGFKERVLGDPRDRHSIRGRRRREFQSTRRRSTLNFMNRNKAGMPTSGRDLFSAAGRGFGRQAKQRQLPFAGRRIPLTSATVPTGQTSVGSVLKGAANAVAGRSIFNTDTARAGVAGVAGGLVAGALVRTGLVDMEQATAEANERGLQRAKTIADYDAGILMAAIGGTHVPTGIAMRNSDGSVMTDANGNVMYQEGDALTATHRAEGRNYSRDIADVTGSAIALMLWSRDAETHDWIRQTIANNPNYTDAEKDQIWNNATYYRDIKALHPDLNSMDWRTGQIKDGKIVDFVEKTISRENINSIFQKGENWYRMLGDVRERITDPSNSLTAQDRLAAAIGFNSLYDQIQDNAEQQMMFNYRGELEGQFFSDDNNNVYQRDDKSGALLDKDGNPPADPGRVRSANITQLLSDDRAREFAYDRARTIEGSVGDEGDPGYLDNKEVLSRQMRKAYPETFGGLAGRKNFMGTIERFTDESDRKSPTDPPTEIEVLKNAAGITT